MAEQSLPETPSAEAEPTRQTPMYQPRFDIVESKNELTLYGDVPGVDESNIDIRYENEQLTIIGRVPERNADVSFMRQEYGTGDYHRSFTIGESIDASKITAEANNGVLIVHLPKSDAAKPRRIQVKSV